MNVIEFFKAFTPFQFYMLGINVIAFLLMSIDFILYKNDSSAYVPVFIIDIIMVFGGSIGCMLAVTLLDWKIRKSNSTAKMYNLMWFIIHITILFVLYGPNNANARSFLSSFYANNKFLCIYIPAINLLSFVLFGIDKLKAIKHKWRIREIILLGLAVIGGALGEILGMDFFNHKGNSPQFSEGVPQMLIAHLFLLTCYVAGLF